MLDKGVKRHIEQKRTEAIALKYTTVNFNKCSVKLFSYDGSLKIGIEASDKIFYVVRYVMVFKDLVNKIVMYFAECIFEI